MCAVNKHLSFDDRLHIESSLNKNHSFKQIASQLNRDPSTISKEIRKHRHISYKVGFNRIYNPCMHRFSCDKRFICSQCKYKNGHLCRHCRNCINVCKDFKEEICTKLSDPPYVCNACEENQKCSLKKQFYDSSFAFKEYTTTKSDSRKGIIINQDDIDHLNQLLTPLVKKGHSIHHIFIHHKDEIMFSEKTLYKIIDTGILNIRNIDLPRKIRRKERKKKSHYKVDKHCVIGRTYHDFLMYIKEHPDVALVEMDSVEGNKGGKVLLTIHFKNSNFMLAYLRDYNDSKSVTDIFNHLYGVLGKETFKQMFPLILTDNGSEFSNPKVIEFDEEDSQRTRIFYCEVSSPYEKGSCEVNHEFIRRISPKGSSLNHWTQATVDKVMSHINSYGRKSLNDRSPYDVFSTLFGKDVLNKLNIQKIIADDIDLSTTLLTEEERGIHNHEE